MVDKQAVILAVATGTSKSQAARDFGISPAYVGKIVKEAEEAALARAASRSVSAGESEEPTQQELPDEPYVIDAVAALEMTPAPTDDLTLQRVWDLSEQDREQIYYGVVDMGNKVADVAEVYQLDREVVVRIISLEAARRKAQQEQA